IKNAANYQKLIKETAKTITQLRGIQNYKLQHQHINEACYSLLENAITVVTNDPSLTDESKEKNKQGIKQKINELNNPLNEDLVAALREELGKWRSGNHGPGRMKINLEFLLDIQENKVSSTIDDSNKNVDDVDPDVQII